jgi:hypothetical protein
MQYYFKEQHRFEMVESSSQPLLDRNFGVGHLQPGYRFPTGGKVSVQPISYPILDGNRFESDPDRLSSSGLAFCKKPDNQEFFDPKMQ